MSNTVVFDPTCSDEIRRKQLYNGELCVFSPSSGSVALCEFARQMLEEAFCPYDPQTAQYHMLVDDYVGIVAPLKPTFIHHPTTMELLRRAMVTLGCDLNKTYIDVPRFRMVTHGGYLTAGVGYAHHPHRDTWYSAPMCQLNWWLPIYPIEPDNAMAFHPRYWDRPVANGSSSFNYYEWNSEGRMNAARYVKSDTRKQPRAEEPLELDPQLRIVCPVGGIIVFSAAQMHSTVANTSGRTRYSIDFRTVNIDDVVAIAGAPNIDSFPSGTSLRDFRRGADGASIPDEVVRLYDRGGPSNGSLVFRPPADESAGS